MNNIRSWVTSKELSRGWVISGKKGPKENSVITCERFMTVKTHLLMGCLNEMVELTLVGCKIVALITMSNSRDVEIG